MKRILSLFVAFVAAIALSAKTYVVAVGISDYKYINDLVLPENDAKAIAAVFKTHTKSVVTITGAAATRATILKAMKDQFARATKNDQIIFYFSGHGYEKGFCPYDMRDLRGGVSYSDVYEVFRASKAGRKIIFADACHAGGLRKSPPSPTPQTSTDVMLFLSCRSSESSIETPRMKNGFFTTYLASGLRGGADDNRDRKITARELYNYVHAGVKKLSGDRQHPVMWGKFRDNMTIIAW